MKSQLLVGSLALALLASMATVSMADLVATSDSTVNATNQKKVTFSVPGMTWPVGCPALVKSTMANVAGVLSTKVDFKAGTATCTVDPAKFDAKVAVTALKGAFKDAALKKDAR